MGFFSSSSDEHHGDECRDRTGTWWAKPNPMGWGSNDARTVKRADSSTRKQDSRATMHGSRGERVLMSGRGGFINWGRGSGNIRATGDGPGRRR